MTINEYLSQLPKLKRQAERSYRAFKEAEAAATDPGCTLNFSGAETRSRSGCNTTELQFVRAADALQEYQDARRRYIAFRYQLEKDLDGLLYWQGCLLFRVYVFNVLTGAADSLDGAGDILRTRNRREIVAKLREAQAALAEVLRARGKEIE